MRQKITKIQNDRKLIGKSFKTDSIVNGMRWFSCRLGGKKPFPPTSGNELFRVKNSHIRAFGVSSTRNYLLLGTGSSKIKTIKTKNEIKFCKAQEEKKDIIDNNLKENM